MKQVFVSWAGRTLLVDLSDDASAADLAVELHCRESIPLDLVWMQCNGRLLAAENDVAAQSTVTVNLRLEGGKGGFGSMLRFLGSQRSGAETDNIDVCRDLNGRRLKHVQDEKKIAEWIAKKEEREKEKALQKQLKRERKMAVPKHTFDHHALVVELDERAKAVEESVAAGIRRVEECREGAAAAATKPASGKAKRLCIRDEWEDEDMSDSGSSESDSPVSSASSSSGAAVGTSTSAAAAAATAAESAAAPDGKTPEIELPAAASLAAKSGGRPAFATKSNGHGLTASAAPPSKANGSSSSIINSGNDKAGNCGSSNGNGKAGEKVKAALPKVDVLPKKLGLAPYSSAKELEAVGLDTLKAALMYFGVKCGGTLEQRAERLFSLKDVAKDDIPAQLRAKK